jgi:hypothetical protein
MFRIPPLFCSNTNNSLLTGSHYVSQHNHYALDLNDGRKDTLPRGVLIEMLVKFPRQTDTLSEPYFRGGSLKLFLLLGYDDCR